MLNYKQFERTLCCIPDIMDVKFYMQKRTCPRHRLVQLNALSTTMLQAVPLGAPQQYHQPHPNPGKLHIPCVSPPSPAPGPGAAGSQALSSHSLAGEGQPASPWPRHLMLENKLGSPVCQWPSGGAGAASFQFFGVIINNRWNKSRAEAGLFASRAFAGIISCGCSQPVRHWCSCPWHGQSQHIFCHAWTCHRWSSDIKLPTFLPQKPSPTLHLFLPFSGSPVASLWLSPLQSWWPVRDSSYCLHDKLCISEPKHTAHRCT